MGMSAALSQDLLKYYFTAGAPITRPSAWYLSLHTADPGRSGGSEVAAGTDSAYARKAISFAVADAGSDGIFEAKNSADVNMNAGAVGASYIVTHVGVWTAATGGTFLGSIQLAVPLSTVAGTINSFAIGDLYFEGI
ncbi:hypothetical protein M2D07_006660 [Pseudomonas sp. BGr12]|uniref:phage tail fiber protein n=1 Tax=Pseudomonas sp. BGr12 TaxID=2936269 RepID=UPI00255A2D60|nr:hypothetical protein [Pseudomonas sp. BJa5]MDL2426696.1 hypothetical protein [Pseudomonas sp. BJa5]